ncbi:unnamed protein product [Discosporangium mesarthrocarpum]
MSRTIVFDNGAGKLKAGFAGEGSPSHSMPNCTAKQKNQMQLLVGDETVNAVKDSSQLTFQRPFDRGYLINWETESEVWTRMMGRKFLNVDPTDTKLLTTEAPFGPMVLQEAANEVVFEYFGFAACYRCPSSALSCYYAQVLEEEMEKEVKGKEKENQAAQARAEATAKAEAASRAAKAKAEAEAAAAKAAAAQAAARAAKAAAAGIVHGRGTRMSTGVLVGGRSGRQFYDPTEEQVTRAPGSSSKQSQRSPSCEPEHFERGCGWDWGVGLGGGSGDEGIGTGAAAGAGAQGEEVAEVVKAFEPMSDVCVVVDSGFSFTHIIPFYQGRALHKSSLRINVGGKVLTNYLKEVVSYRHFNMMDNFQLMKEVKESLTFCSLDLDGDLRGARSEKPDIVREFVLPDPKSGRRGYAREVDFKARAKRRRADALGEIGGEQVLSMGTERFMVPEILFHPSDIGLRQMGLAECVANCIESCPALLRPALFANVLLTGGNWVIPNLQERLQRELRSVAPNHSAVNVILPPDPDLHAWRGGSRFGSCAEFPSFAVSKQEYEEFGHAICSMRFADW